MAFNGPHNTHTIRTFDEYSTKNDTDYNKITSLGASPSMLCASHIPCLRNLRTQNKMLKGSLRKPPQSARKARKKDKDTEATKGIPSMTAKMNSAEEEMLKSKFPGITADLLNKTLETIKQEYMEPFANETVNARRLYERKLRAIEIPGKLPHQYPIVRLLLQANEITVVPVHMMKGKNKDGEEIDLRYSFPLSPPAQKKLTVWVVDDENVRDDGYNITFDAEELLKYAKHKLGPQILEALQLNFANGDILECLGKDRKVEK